MEAPGATFKTFQVFRSETANQYDVDFTAVGSLGPPDAVIVNVVGADRELILHPQAGGTSTIFTVKDGRSPVFDLRVTSLTIGAGTSAKLEVVACYRDAWE